MSELKEHMFCECDEIVREYRGTLSNEMRPYYLKSEADKVIADLEESHKMEVEQLLIEIAELKKQVHDYAQGLYVIQARADKEARHQKYKRCLAMYRYCSIKALYELDFKGNDVEWKWYSKWMHKCFKIAEKFKEAK